jgi:hypothetical protein
MDLDIKATLSAVRSHCMASGLFDTVNGHQPKTTPAPTGLAAAVWLGPIRAVPRASGLAVTSAAVTLIVAIYKSAQVEPADTIEPAMGHAVGTMIGRLMGDLTLGDTVTSLDPLGMVGAPVVADPTYHQYDDGASLQRVFTITIPALVADCWEQAP